MGEFASKGVAGTGLGLGIAGTALGVLAGSNGAGGLLGGLFGNGCQPQLSALMAENGMLKSEKYSDAQDATLYQATRSENQKLRDDLFLYIKPLAEESAANRERVAVIENSVSKNAKIADLREKLVRSELGSRIDSVAQVCGSGIAQLNQAVAGINDTLSGITKTVIPRTAICPEVMERWNSWVAPTASAPAVQPITGNVTVN